jgi:Anti-sigma-K factor rskA
MTNGPDFRDLAGDEGGREELDRLRRVHDLLVAAGPPPELSPAVANPPEVEESKVREFRRRRPVTVFALAAAAAVAAFMIGYAVADKRTSFETARQLSMHGVGQLAAAQAQIDIGTHDTGGNYPLSMTVRGLPHLPRGGWYELLLSRHGRPTLSCGSFAVDGQNETIRLSVPYDLTELGKLYDGWVVVRHLPKGAAAPVVMTT